MYLENPKPLHIIQTMQFPDYKTESGYDTKEQLDNEEKEKEIISRSRKRFKLKRIPPEKDIDRTPQFQRVNPNSKNIILSLDELTPLK